MTMEKYGVASVATTQKAALEKAQSRLAELRASHEKTASETQEIARLELEAAELTIALTGH